jgi:hypothetical protein
VVLKPGVGPDHDLAVMPGTIDAGEQLIDESCSAALGVGLPFAVGVSEEPCKAGRKDQPCPRELTAEPIRKKMLLLGRSEATPEP